MKYDVYTIHAGQSMSVLGRNTSGLFEVTAPRRIFCQYTMGGPVMRKDCSLPITNLRLYYENDEEFCDVPIFEGSRLWNAIMSMPKGAKIEELGREIADYIEEEEGRERGLWFLEDDEDDKGDVEGPYDESDILYS